MSEPLFTKITRWFAVASALGFGWEAVAQRRVEEVEPQLFRMRVTDSSVGVYGEGRDEETSYRGGTSSSYSRYFFGPLMGLNLDGSIYHPNLVSYSLNSDWVVGWAEEKYKTSSGKGENRSQYEYLGNFSARALILPYKPYHTDLFATSGHSYHDYDFFNRVQVDSLRYGVNSGYSQGPVPFSVSVARYEEETSGFGTDSSFSQTTINLDAHNDRQRGNTSFRYGFNDYTRDQGSATIAGIENSIGISDRETFGAQDNIELRNTVGLSKHDISEGPRDTTPTDSVTAASELRIDHTPNLTSLADVNYRSDDSRIVDSENLDGGAGIEHRLFSSLTSGLRLQATRYTSDSEGGDFESTQYTGTWSENYTKRLSRSSQLTVGGSLGLTHTDQDSDATAQIAGERHTFSAGLADSFFLALINVEQDSIEVFDEARTIRYIRDADYSVLRVGERTQIQLIVGNPSGLTRTTPVLVDYRASGQGSGTIDGQFSTAEVRLDLYGGRLGFYGRFYDAQNDGSKGLVVESQTDIAVGADTTWKWLRAGIEYQIHDATFASYNALRLYQTLTFTPAEASTLSVTFTQGTIDYEDGQDRNEQYYTAIGRYHQALTRRLWFDLDAGVSQRTGTVVDQFLAAVRPGIAYSIGQLSVKAGYEFEYRDSDTTGEERVKHWFIVRARRSF